MRTWATKCLSVLAVAITSFGQGNKIACRQRFTTFPYDMIGSIVANFGLIILAQFQKFFPQLHNNYVSPQVSAILVNAVIVELRGLKQESTNL